MNVFHPRNPCPFLIDDSSAPSMNMSIHHVYGFRSYDTRNNIKYNLEKNIVYHTAALGIVQKARTGS